jgi:tetratricopeptide (TPR) repeat protein
MNSLPREGLVFERRVALITGVIVVLAVIYLVVRNQPFSDPNLVVLSRIILALAVGIVGGTIPGFLNIRYSGGGFAIRGAGALALFVITYFGSPHVEALHLPDTEYLKLENEVIRHLADRNNCDTALVETNRLNDLRPHDAVAENLKGDALYCLGNVEQALHAFESAATDDPSYGAAQYNKAAALIRLGKYAVAQEILSNLIKHEPTSISARYNLAVAEAALGNFSDAFDNFQKVYERDQNYDAALGLGFTSVLQQQAGSVEKATRYFKIASAIKPQAVCVLYGESPVDSQLKDLQPYLDIYHVVESDPRFLAVRAAFDSAHAAVVCT